MSETYNIVVVVNHLEGDAYKALAETHADEFCENFIKEWEKDYPRDPLPDRPPSGAVEAAFSFFEHVINTDPIDCSGGTMITWGSGFSRGGREFMEYITPFAQAVVKLYKYTSFTVFFQWYQWETEVYKLDAKYLDSFELVQETNFRFNVNHDDDRPWQL